MNRRALVKAFVLLFLPLLGVTVGPALVESHAVLVKSSPAARAVLTRPPARVQLWFSERLEPAFSSASVWSPSGKQVDKRDARVSPADPKELCPTRGSVTKRHPCLGPLKRLSQLVRSPRRAMDPSGLHGVLFVKRPPYRVFRSAWGRGCQVAVQRRAHSRSSWR